MTTMIRTRWAAIGAAVAITLGGGGLGLVAATSPSDATTFVPITPCRVMDTRPAPDTVGPRSAPLAAGDTHTVSVHGDHGNCTGIPSTATAVQLNVTAVGASTLTFLTLWPAGETRPLASSLNPSPGQPPTPNAVTTGLDDDGQFNIFNKFGSVDVLADITGYHTDHHHDDRYPTRTEIDARLASGKYLLPLFTPKATDLSFSSLRWVLPPDYTDGTALTLLLTITHGNDPGGCTVRVSKDFVFVYRDGEQINLDGGLTTGEAAFDAANTARVVAVDVIETPTAVLRRGDAIQVDVFTTGGTCSPDKVGLAGAIILYE